jgi:hypothetical protein
MSTRAPELDRPGLDEQPPAVEAGAQVVASDPSPGMPSHRYEKTTAGDAL